MNTIDIKSRTEVITPEKARLWLATSRRNRPIAAARVARYARAMGMQRWSMNGESIAFDKDGHLLNGHHRMHACIKANVAFESLVVRGVEPGVGDTYDQGGKRSLQDLLALAGESRTRELAGAITLLWRQEQGLITATTAVDNSEAVEFLARRPQIRQSVGRCMGARSIISVPILSLVHCLGVEADQADAAELFVEAVIGGVNLSKNNPARLLRERLNTQSRGMRLDRLMTIALTIKAYNYFSQDEALGILRWSRNEEFPEFGMAVSEILQRPHQQFENHRPAGTVSQRSS